MRKQDLIRLVMCAALAAAPMIIPTIACGQAPVPPAAAPAPLPQMPPSLVPVKVVDLMTAEGSAAFGAQWKTMEAKIVEGPAIANAMPGYKKSYDIQPHAGESGFDDSSWPTIDAKGLADRRGGGKVSFLWYRASLTIPAKIGDFETAGATVVLTAYVDDYAEVWINGQMPRRRGLPQPGHDPGLQHAQSCGARRCCQGGRQVPDRNLRRQRADFGCAHEFRLVPRGEDRIFPVKRFQIQFSGPEEG